MAGIKEFKRVAGVESQEVAGLQTRLLEFFAQFTNNPLLDGVLLTNISLSSTAKTVEHKLGRPHQGWIITKIDANANVWETESSKSFIKLTATTNVVVDLWVF
jgi:hypothetical protein